jgi:hypothetical protein
VGDIFQYRQGENFGKELLDFPFFGSAGKLHVISQELYRRTGGQAAD